MSYLVIVQARMGSTRLPGKVLMDVRGKPLVKHLVDRLAAFDPVFAIPAEDDDILGDHIRSWGGRVFAWDGPVNDVAGRFAAVLKAYPYSHFIRVCADSPFVSTSLVWAARNMIAPHQYVLLQDRSGSVEACHTFTFFDALPHMTPDEREHVLTYFRRDRLVIDTQEDLIRVNAGA